jgi:hypothetical protein
MIASGREINLDVQVKWGGRDFSAIEIARVRGDTEIVSLLERFTKNQAQIRHEIRVELAIPDALAAELFAMVIFLCDGLLKPRSKKARLRKNLPETLRFFGIAQRLPMELQVILCFAVYDSGKERIPSKDSEPAFKSLARALL